MTEDIKIVFTDLDGTLLNNERIVHSDDLLTLAELGKKRIIRCIATGRSVFSLYRVIKPDFPVDYVLFSSGAGIMDWNTKSIIRKNTLSKKDVTSIQGNLKELDVDFMVHKSIPDNHHFYYSVKNNENNADFLRRIELYKDYARPLNGDFPHVEACQFVVILRQSNGLKDQIFARLGDFNLIRTTSPLDHVSVWIEVFPKHVSKGYSADWLCDMLGLSSENALAIGNDFNDEHLLEWAGTSYVVENAASLLKEKFKIINSNQNAALTDAVRKLKILRESD